ncbi:protein NPAT [Scleropages formosus]|uniref:Nuclear protein, ataxia-telangiectasia locus n=1 Tax=Scleropages formosus TaxID=113540 RepID=A0A8C9RPJ3_SCLFO|nr:protein NPAT [Scleropages formosus]
MLLPSDIARLVLGYLQQEGLSATSQAFVLESPNLKEYAEHTTEDGAVPACVFSLFGKNLTTILNEYVAVKAKETCQEHQIPAMMTSLWKKLEFTLNQIKCMQNSPAVHQNQRMRTRNGIVNMRRQRTLSSMQSASPRLLSVTASPCQYVSSPINAPQGPVGHSTPVCYSSLQVRATPLCVSQPQVQDGSRLLTRESPLQVVVPDHRINPGPLSPGRRKCDSPRRMGGGLSVSSASGRISITSNILTVEQGETHDAVSENFPQMVIENAREKILNDKLLQEKLAENINKILGSEISPQSSRQATCSTTEQDQSIDEILGLQGEIHMTDDAIQDILEQTESDPAFKALFDLFDYGKEKNSDGDHLGDGSLSTTTLESDEAEHDCLPGTGYQGTEAEDSTPGTESRKSKAKKVQELKSKKTRKTTHPLPSTSRLVTASTLSRPLNEVRQDSRASLRTKMGPAESRTLTGNSRQLRTSQPAPQASPSKDSGSSHDGRGTKGSQLPEEETEMEVDRPLSTLSPDAAETFTVQSDSQKSPLALGSTGGEPPLCTIRETTESQSEASVSTSVVSVETVAGNSEQAEQPAVGLQTELPNSGGASDPPVGQQEPGSSPSASVSAPSVSETQKPDLACFSSSVCSSTSPEPRMQECRAKQQEVQLNCVASPPPGSQNNPLPSVTPTSPIPLPSKEPDPSEIVSLKIIVSDEQAEQSGDASLSSTTGERLPTIILLSPAKSPAKALAGAGSSVTVEETVQAVSCLQSTEMSTATGKPGETPMAVGTEEILELTLPGDLVSENGFIQLVPSTTPYGSSGGYFIVTEPATMGHHSNVMVLPSSAALGQVGTSTHVLATPPRSRVDTSYSAGSTLVISSPVQPMLPNMMVPVSVVGQKNTGSFTIVSNQVMALPVSSSKNQVKLKPKPLLAPKNTTDGTAGPDAPTIVADGRVKADELSQEKVTMSHGSGAGAGLSHRRVLHFDSPTEPVLPTNSTLSHTVMPQPVTPPVPAAAFGREHAKENSGTFKCRSVQPTILKSSRMVRAVAANPAENVKTPESQKNCGIRPSDDHRRQSGVQNEPCRAADCQSANVRNESALPEVSKRSDSRKQQIVKRDNTETGPKKDSVDISKASSITTDHRTRLKAAGARKDDLRNRQEAAEKSQAKGRECRVERRSSPQELPHVTANKENELEGSRHEHHLTAAVSQGEAPPVAGMPAPAPQGGTCRAPSKTTPLTKQAAEMLQDIQGQNPTSSPSKRSGLVCSELPLPRTPCPGVPTDEVTDCLKTPARGRGLDGTPRRLAPPATPEMPTCSPASEAGSESSISMAAQTLIFLSRAAVEKPGTPLKDSMQQQGVSYTNTTVSSKGKKRKQDESHGNSTVKELQLSVAPASKKKSKKQKRFLDSFPDNLDVDKFLSSLHYDE